MKTALWTSLAIILLCATAFAQQASILQPYRLPQFASDVRLRQPVTFTALSVPLPCNGSLSRRAWRSERAKAWGSGVW